MRRISYMVVYLCVCFISTAQGPVPEVVSSAGGFLKSTKGSVSFTVGETMIPTYKTNTELLTLGFQQDTPPVSDSLGNYRSFVDGRWVDASTWQIFSGFKWADAGLPPIQSTRLVTIVNQVRADSTISAGKVVVNGSGKLSISNEFTINPYDTTAVMTINAGGILELGRQGLLLTPSFTPLASTVDLNGGTMDIDGGGIGSPYNPPFNFNIYGNKDSNGVKSTINIDSSFQNEARITMNAGAIHWYAGDISGPSLTSDAAIINYDSFSITTTKAIPMHMYDLALYNYKNLVVDSAAGVHRSSVTIAPLENEASFTNGNNASMTIIADAFDLACFSTINGGLTLQKQGFLAFGSSNFGPSFSATVNGTGTLLFSPNAYSSGQLNFPGQDTVTLLGCLNLSGSISISNQSYITTFATGCGVQSDTLILDPGSVLKSTGGFTVNKYFSWGPDGESLVGNDSFTIAPNATGYFQSGHGYNQTTIVNNGTIIWNYGSIAGIGDSLKPGGSLINNGTIYAALPADGSNLVLTDQRIENNGSLYLSAAGDGHMIFNSQYNDSSRYDNNVGGQVLLQQGVFERNVPGAENGIDLVASGTKFQIGVPNLSFAGPRYFNRGVIQGNNMKMTGAALQPLYGPGSIDSLEIDNPGGVSLQGSQTIKKSLRLTKGNIDLTQFDLIVADSTMPGQATLEGGSAASYIVATSGGYLQREVPNTSAPVIFPIGLSNSYLPATISLAPGSPSFTLGTSLYDSLYSGYDSSDIPDGAAIAANVVQRTWLVKPFRSVGPGIPDASLRLQWNTADQESGFDPAASVQLGHYTGGTWDLGSILPVAGSNPFSVTRVHIASFSPFGLFSGGTALPVTLIQFTGQPVQQGIMLEWQTSSELNNDQFVVERSGNGTNFKALDTVQGRGTTSLQNNYQYLDAQPLSGDNYYQLQQVDKGGHSSYSKIIEIHPPSGAMLTLFPNPATTVLNLTLPLSSTGSSSSSLVTSASDGKMEMAIYDELGKLMQTALYESPGSLIQIDISRLNKGSYTIILVQNSRQQTLRFLKL